MKKTIKLAAVLLILNIARTVYAQPPNIVWETEAYVTSVRDVSFSADGLGIATVSSGSNSPVKLWSAIDGTLQQSITLNSSGALSVDLSADGQNVAAGYMVSGYPPGALADVWDLFSQTLVNDFGGAYVDFSPDGLYLASGGGGVNSYLTVHEVTSGNTIFSEYHGGYITAVAYSPNGDVVASGGSNNKVRLWDVATGTVLHELTGHTDNISSLAFSVDGTMLASAEGGFDVAGQSVIKLWSVANGSLLQTLNGHGDWIHDIDYSPDDQYLISSGRESTSPNLVQRIKIWRISDGNLVQEYDASAYSVNYSPDGQHFAYGSPYGDLFLALNPFAPGYANLDIAVTYVSGSPVPALGGLLNFDVFLQNNEISTVNFDLWIEIPPQVTPPSVPNRNLTFPGGFSINRPGMNWPIPASWPAGNYQMVWNVGDLATTTVLATDSFPFEKSVASDASGYTLWEIDGDPLDQLFDNLDMDEFAAVSDFALLGNYPNPFNPTTTISYTMDNSDRVKLSVYDLSGRQVATLIDGYRDAGIHEVTFDASSLASGVYIYRLSADNFNAIGKMMLVK